MSEKKQRGNLERREFIKISTAASLGLATGSLWMPKTIRAATDDTSRVVVVFDEQASSGSQIDPEIARIMLDAGLKELTETATPQDAWLALFPELTASMSMGIKIACLNQTLPTHPEIAYPLAESLSSTPVGASNYPENQILIWDREDWELINSGYDLNTSSAGVRCFGTNNAASGGYGYPQTIYGAYQAFSGCFTGHSDRLINLCSLRNHTISGVTLSLKNHYGTISSPGNMHPYDCDPYIPALNLALRETYGEREKLIVCDGIFGIHTGGPTGPPQFIENKIILSQDAVALDYVCRDIISGYPCTTISQATHIETSAGATYNLGIADPADIEIININNPSSTGIQPGKNGAQPSEISLGKNYPEPFNAGTAIPITLGRPGEVRLEIYDVKGRRIDMLYQGTLSVGKHAINWNGTGTSGQPLASGRYFSRLHVDGKVHSRAITLVR
ncbi:hypothetical protein CEE37_11940 [candidate division LCP-89 bacterium B3_LCP]|uniref:DUF362 domain-containing protein n=1 Tax=candidate division LCP-89 bacterium B3_LCP TaxID=2012998 RepID=A0A532UW10_UNCL8|nr:MAG: hypothetical protein CEE37_11940 [candidate division LCP-89 bacterium B3_LCP]